MHLSNPVDIKILQTIITSFTKLFIFSYSELLNHIQCKCCSKTVIYMIRYGSNFFFFFFWGVAEIQNLILYMGIVRRRLNSEGVMV